MVFGVGVVVYVVPAVEKKTQSKSGKNTQKDEKKKRQKKSAEKTNPAGLSLSHPSIFPSHFLFFYASRALTLLLTTTRYN